MNAVQQTSGRDFREPATVHAVRKRHVFDDVFNPAPGKVMFGNEVTGERLVHRFNEPNLELHVTFLEETPPRIRERTMAQDFPV